MIKNDRQVFSGQGGYFCALSLCSEPREMGGYDMERRVLIIGGSLCLVNDGSLSIEEMYEQVKGLFSL